MNLIYFYELQFIEISYSPIYFPDADVKTSKEKDKKLNQSQWI